MQVHALRLSPAPGHGPKVAGQSDGAATPALVTSAAALADATNGVEGLLVLVYFVAQHVSRGPVA